MKSFMKFIEILMRNKGKLIAIIFLLGIGIFACFYHPGAVWANNLRALFVNNGAIIYSINVRTFGAKDYNKNDIIEPELGEVTGTFINAIPKLNVLKQNGINTVYLMPITKIGKLHARGTAGSLYALDAFDKLNPQLFDETDLEKDLNKQAKKFINEAHKLEMHVIVDLPGCGSYDLSLEKPSLFEKDAKGKIVTPADWTDVRLFSAYSDKNGTLNRDLINEHKKFFDLMLSLGVDGVRIDAAATKPIAFWSELIGYVRKQDPEFLFLAEASPEWENPPNYNGKYLSCEELLEVGFDGYYEDWSDLVLIKSANEFFKKIEKDMKIIAKFNGNKSVIGTFATHDQKSPVVAGKYYWEIINWLNCTLPINPYILDGFPAGDTYVYKFQDKYPTKTYTDNTDSYDLKKGNIDLYNFSRAPYFFNSPIFVSEFADAIKFRYMMYPIITSKEITRLKVNNDMVYAFKRQLGQDSVIVVGSLDQLSGHKVKVTIPGFNQNDFVMPFKMIEAPVAKNGYMEVTLQPYEIQVFASKKPFSPNRQ